MGKPRLVWAGLQLSLELAGARALDEPSDPRGRGNYDTVLRWHEETRVRVGDAVVKQVHALGVHEESE
jgi:hypothetical protein